MLVTTSGGNEMVRDATWAAGWWKVKFATRCGCPFSRILKSSALRFVTGLPLPSVTTTSVTTSRVFVRSTVSDLVTSLFWSCAGAAGTVTGVAVSVTTNKIVAVKIIDRELDDILQTSLRRYKSRKH